MVIGPENAVSQVEIRHSDAAPDIGVVFALSLSMRMEIGVFLDFLKNKRLPYLKKISASPKL